MTIALTTREVIELARKHIDACRTWHTRHQARLRIYDATTLADRGQDAEARVNALESLAYSVGEHHEDYLAAKVR